MDIERLQESIRACSTETELIYSRMGNAFPSLLSITKDTDSTSLSSLKRLLSGLASGFQAYREDEVSFFESYNAKNNALFTALNERMGALDTINERVSSIRSDSEELEIISLNAMVISIKSGEKGRAFSVITDTLKRLSARMISLSNDLMLDEKHLLEKNDLLRASFTNVLKTQRDLLDIRPAENTAEIQGLIQSATRALEAMEERSRAVTSPIVEAMSGIQLQDIIRQSIDQILLALGEIRPELARSASATVEERLDQLTLDTDLLDVCIRIAADVRANLESSIATFSGNWQLVHRMLDTVEESRLGFIAEYLQGTAALPARLDRMNGAIADYLTHISLYQRGQKTMVRDSSTIVSEVKRLRLVFDSIKPIIARLQHVRITQQIEVAKNTAIGSVKDTVDYMSDLIIRSDALVQSTRKELELFIASIEELTSDFMVGSENDHAELESIKREKTNFFNAMKVFQEDLSMAIGHLRVYPDSFRDLCVEIDAHLDHLKSIAASVAAVMDGLGQGLEELRSERLRVLRDAGLSDWTIHNDRLKELVERFTITSHKEAAGQIGGFDVEHTSLDTIESGDVTLFF